MRNYSQLISSLFLLVITLPFAFSWGAFPSIIDVSVTPNSQDFINCLQSNSNNVSLISQLVFTPVNSSFLPIWQARINNFRYNVSSTPRPSIIVTPVDDSQIRTTLLCSKKHGYELRIRSGGHDLEALSSSADVPFVMLDLNLMRKVDVDVANKAAWVQAGAVLGEVYYAISNKTDTLYFPAGFCPTVGVGGYMGGGGYGNLIRKYGTGADNVVDVRFMDVNGNIMDKKSMGEDLFWAIRGGGASSFGIVLAWKLRLVDVPALVTVFSVNKVLEQGATEILHKWQSFAPSTDRDLSIRVAITTVNVTNSTEKTLNIQFNGLYQGKIDKLLKLLDKSFPELGVTREICEEVRMVVASLVLIGFPSNTSTELLLTRSIVLPLDGKNKLDYVKTPIPITGLKKIWKKVFENDGSQVLYMQPFGGKNDEISETAIPYPHRDVLYQFHQQVTFYDQKFDTTPTSLKRINWLRSFNDLIAPYVSSNPRQAYLNYNDLDFGFEAGTYEQASAWGERYWKRSNFKKLIRIKAKVDPGNFFKHPQSIPVFAKALSDPKSFSDM